MISRELIAASITVVAVSVTAGTAFAISREPASPVRTAAEVYSSDMSLEEISKLSQGVPGLVAPPCPSESDVQKLKEADLPVGPCDPFPEKDAPLVLAKEGQIRADGSPEESVCATIPGQDAAHTVNLPCGVGLKLVDTTDRRIDGEDCVVVTYVPSTDSPKVTETLCPSSPRSPGGVTLGEQPHTHEDATTSEGSVP